MHISSSLMWPSLLFTECEEEERRRGWKRRGEERGAKCCCQPICLEGHYARTKYSCKIRETEREKRTQWVIHHDTEKMPLHQNLLFKLCARQKPPKICHRQRRGRNTAQTFMWLFHYFFVCSYIFHALIWLCISLHPSASLPSSISLCTSVFALLSGLPVFFHLAFSAFRVVFF